MRRRSLLPHGWPIIGHLWQTLVCQPLSALLISHFLTLELHTDVYRYRFFIIGSAIALVGSIIGAFAKDVNTLIVAELVGQSPNEEARRASEYFLDTLRRVSDSETSVYWHSRGFSAILLLGRRRNRAYEMALYRKLLLLSDDNSYKSSGRKSCLHFPNIPWAMA